MEHEQRINLLDDARNQPSKFRIKNWVEINDESLGTCKASNQIKLKPLFIGSHLCNYSNANIDVKRNYNNSKHSSRRCSCK